MQLYMTESLSVVLFSFKYHLEKLGFLGATLYLADGKLAVDVFSKPTDAPVYLLPSSNHPPNTTLNIPYGVGLVSKPWVPGGRYA